MLTHGALGSNQDRFSRATEEYATSSSPTSWIELFDAGLSVGRALVATANSAINSNSVLRMILATICAGFVAFDELCKNESAVMFAAVGVNVL